MPYDELNKFVPVIFLNRKIIVRFDRAFRNALGNKKGSVSLIPFLELPFILRYPKPVSRQSGFLQKASILR
jgi:hypothetical protein